MKIYEDLWSVHFCSSLTADFSLSLQFQVHLLWPHGWTLWRPREPAQSIATIATRLSNTTMTNFLILVRLHKDVQPFYLVQMILNDSTSISDPYDDPWGFFFFFFHYVHLFSSIFRIWLTATLNWPWPVDFWQVKSGRVLVHLVILGVVAVSLFIALDVSRVRNWAAISAVIQLMKLLHVANICQPHLKRVTHVLQFLTHCHGKP